MVSTPFTWMRLNSMSISKIAVQYPEIRLRVCEGYTDTMRDWVLAGPLDIAIVNAPARETSPAARHILDEEMMVTYRAGRKRALPRVVPFPSLHPVERVIPSRRHGLRRILDDAAAEAGFSLSPRLEIDTLSAICEVVASTDLVTIRPIGLHASLVAGRIDAPVKAAGDPVRSRASPIRAGSSLRRCRRLWTSSRVTCER
jgi:LysR family transcriptional regulator, nitrogen assimilation regulatory protein